MDLRFLDFKIMGDERGSLAALEEYRNIPFNIKRVYYMFNTVPNVRRGCHAHKELNQVLVCVKGSCRILMDDGKEKKEVLIGSPAQGLFVGKMIWHEMYDFSPDCVLLVLASDYYDETDYIRSYGKFTEYLNNWGMIH